MNDHARALLQVAKENPWLQFSMADLSALMGIPKTTLEMMNKTEDSPFVSGRSRPERVSAWLDNHLGWKPSAEK
ncbi:MAG TPA: hypothetical protein VNQ90_02740 [Chthoniobacteraceae bacterium]|nr:hypothetical protein [Chthoniobacteraceae bacterium]